MADPLMLLSLQPPPLPFLIFSSSYSSLHRRWGLSRSGIRFSVSEFRLSSQLQLANSTSPSQSSSTAPEKFDLVSTTQLKDGSQVFRFGDASEVERYRETEEKARCLELERKQHAEIEEEEASEGVRDGGHALADLDPVSELESLKEKSVVKIKPVKSSTETVSEKEYGAPPPARLSSVIKIKDRKRVRSPAKKKKETPIPVTVSGSEDEAEAKIASVSNLNSIVSVAEVIPTSATEEKTNENVEPLSSQVMEKVSVNEIRGDCETNGYQQLTESRVEEQATPISSSSQHGSQLNDLKEVAHVSTTELDDSLEERKKTDEAEENLVVEPTATVDVSPDELVVVSPEENLVVEPTATVSVSPDELVVVSPDENLVVEPIATVYVSPGELISTSEATNHSIEETAETPVVDTSEMANDGENGTSTIEDEVAVIDSKNDNGSISKTVNDTNDENLQLPEPETASLQPIEVVSVREELVSKAFYLESGSASLQNPFKALAGREDAYFISENNNWLGVADGVSQWSFEEINEGMHAQELMSNCEKIISDETAEICDPVQVLHRSVNETKSSGSSTALVAHLSNNELHIANIGDSGFILIRNRTILQKSAPMFHHFCFPLHVTRGDDVLKLAEVYNVNVEEGDVILTATDGLFDNLYEKEIVSIVCRLLEQGLEPQRIAELIAAKAQEVGRSKTERTPFSDAAKEEGHDGYRGGKLDAVTVIVSLVKTVSS
ncbi:LOW QUALITY PROTEIN: probable protein phosphatase 2C 62 [Raphanus sativus]|uniref:Protein phosphatase n=1 Tax=Raphanus sativus TaxID=3726 RepID=A0A9W3CKK9_RAPSA|nr:LOW QUALITY PROTEIN: probable protein phosphatase 2C 62 [Raphanus sativus]